MTSASPSAFAAFAAAHAAGMDVLASCAREVRRDGLEAVADSTRLPLATLRDQVEAYKQLRAHADLAGSLAIPVDTLILVSRWSKRVQPDDLPALLRAVENTTYAEAEDHLRAAVRELRRGRRREMPRGTVAVAKRPDFWGRRRLTFHLTDAEYADMQAYAEPFIRRARKDEPALTYGQALHQWLTRQLTRPAQSGAKEYRPVLLMPVDASLIWERGYLVTADGARLDPLEVLQGQLADTGWALQTALDADGVAHVVTVARIQDTRLSTGEHRMITQLESLVCSWPGCHRTAGSCQAHHIQAYRDGGETSWENLTPLCNVHNGMNDDGNRIRNGRIVRGNGGYPGWQRRPGDPVRYAANDLLTAGWRGLTYDAYAKMA